MGALPVAELLAKAISGLKLVAGPAEAFTQADASTRTLVGASMRFKSSHSMLDDAAEAVSSDVQAAEEMSVYRSYIVGMLTNLGRLPLEKIHNNLKMFLQAGDSLKYDKSQREPAGFPSKPCADERDQLARRRTSTQWTSRKFLPQRPRLRR